MSKKQKRILWPTLALIGLVTATVVFLSARNKSAAAQQNLPEFKQRIRVWIHGDDIRPKVIHAWPGKALITIQNETSADVSLQVEQVLPQRTLPVDTVNLPSGSKRLQHEIVLVPGEYVFYDASRPGIRGRLIVAPRE